MATRTSRRGGASTSSHTPVVDTPTTRAAQRSPSPLSPTRTSRLEEKRSIQGLNDRWVAASGVEIVASFALMKRVQTVSHPSLLTCWEETPPSLTWKFLQCLLILFGFVAMMIFSEALETVCYALSAFLLGLESHQCLSGYYLNVNFSWLASILPIGSMPGHCQPFRLEWSED